jgi:hypothetical protein
MTNTLPNTYTRLIDGMVQTMIEVAPGEFVNTISAVKRAEKMVDAASYAKAAA